MTSKPIAFISIALNIIFLLLLFRNGFGGPIKTSHTVNSNYSNFIENTIEDNANDVKWKIHSSLFNKLGLRALDNQLIENVTKIDKEISQIKKRIIKGKKPIDCKRFAKETDEIYSKINQQYNSAIDSLADFAKLKPREQLKHKEKFSTDIEASRLQNCDTTYKTILHLQASKSHLLTQISYLITSRNSNTQTIIPTVIPDKKNYKPGEEFHASIRFVDIALDEIMISNLTVNNNSLEIKDNQLEFSEIVPNEVGSRSLDFKYDFVNRVTKRTLGSATFPAYYNVAR